MSGSSLLPQWATNFQGTSKLEVRKNGEIVGEIQLEGRNQVSFGRKEDNDVALDHSSISRHHALMFFRENDIFIMDLGSTHGTSIADSFLNAKEHIKLDIGDSIVFGKSSRSYLVTGGNLNASMETVTTKSKQTHRPPVPSFSDKSNHGTSEMSTTAALDDIDSNRLTRQQQIAAFALEMSTTAPSMKASSQKSLLASRLAIDGLDDDAVLVMDAAEGDAAVEESDEEEEEEEDDIESDGDGGDDRDDSRDRSSSSRPAPVNPERKLYGAQRSEDVAAPTGHGDLDEFALQHKIPVSHQVMVH